MDVFVRKEIKPFLALGKDFAPASIYLGIKEEEIQKEIRIIPYFELVQRPAYFEAHKNKYTFVVLLEQDMDAKALSEGWGYPFFNQIVYVYHPDRFLSLSAVIDFLKHKKISVHRYLMQGYYSYRLHFMRVQLGNLLDPSSYIENIEVRGVVYDKQVRANVYKINRGRFIQGKGLVHLQQLINATLHLLAQPHVFTDSMPELAKNLGKAEVYFKFGFFLQQTYFKAILKTKKLAAEMDYYQGLWKEAVAQHKRFCYMIHQINLVLVNYYRDAFLNIKVGDRLTLVDKMIQGKFRDLVGRYEVHMPIERFQFLESARILLYWSQLTLNFGILKAKMFVAANKRPTTLGRPNSEFNMFLYHLDLALKEANYLINHTKDITDGEDLDNEPVDREVRNMVKELFRSKVYLDMMHG